MMVRFEQVSKRYKLGLTRTSLPTLISQAIRSSFGRLPEKSSDEKSLWVSDIYIAVSKEVPGAETARISGTFLTKVFEGPYKNAGRWTREMKDYVKSKAKELNKMYFFYTTCPNCAKFYGKNYTVILAQI